MGPNPSQLKRRANVGFLIEQKPEEEAGQGQAPPPPFHFIQTVFGEGARTIIGALTWLLPFTVHFPE